MKKTRLISIALAVLTAAQFVLLPMNVSAADSSVQGIVVNEDPSAYSSITTEQGIKDYVAAYKNTHVTDYVIDVFGKNIKAPTDVSTGFDHVTNLYKEFDAAGIDVWLSFDMNDAYDTVTIASTNLSQFYTGNPQIKRVTHTTSLATTYNGCMDYSYEAVRTYMLNTIKAALNKYNCDGIELNFQSAIWMWAVGGEYNGLDILNAFMRKVDVLVKTFEIKYKKDIKVSVRCASDLETNYELGIDVATWVADGILDRVVPTSYGKTTDFDVPVRVWTALMHPYGGEVVPGIEPIYTISDKSKTSETHTIETLSGIAANCFTQGADKVYMNGLKGNSAYTNALGTIGSYDKLMTVDRKTIPTYNDVIPSWSKSNAQLPKSITKGTTATIRIPVGDVSDDATAMLKFKYDETAVNPSDVVVYVNSAKCTFYGSDSNGLLCFPISSSVLDETYAVVEITAPAKQNLNVSYAEVFVDVPN